MNKSYCKTAIALCMSGALALSSAHADEAEREAGRKEMIGLGTGSLIGALIGGPPGLVIGAIGGVLIGQNQDIDAELAGREQALQDSRRQVAELQHSIQAQSLKTVTYQKRVAAQQSSLAAAAIAKGFAYTVQFRSDSAELEPHYQQQLRQLAGTLALFGELTIRLSGHADPRGSDRHNLELSRRRVVAVRDYLLQSGVPATRILHQAHGEKQAMAVESDAEALFFDRRVQLGFSLADADMRTAGAMAESFVYRVPESIQP